MVSRRALVGVFVAVVLVVSGCASGAEDGAGSATNTSPSGAFDFGAPADSADATRVIEIDASDDFSYSPNTADVSADEVVTFRVSNRGKLDHEFTLGDETVQQKHEQEMEEMGDMDMGDDPNAISVPAGETVELTWKFARSTGVLMGCHVAGHYAGGMRGEITVNDA